MNTEDSLQFVQERLRHNHSSPLTRDMRLRHKPRVTRRFVVAIAKGEVRIFEHVDESVLIKAATGSLWITHDGDPKDVILYPEESYRAEREDAMHVFALHDSTFEIEFEDDVVEH
ncbi:MAG TPA: hypothetical protein VHL79_15760 [Ramlibacter sp.]|jgi:hypothetical protein|nr:hypothetical protein [Ramlibacter sp.]